MTTRKVGSRLSPHAVVRAYVSHRHAILFYSLLLTLVATPLLAAISRDRRLINFFVAINVVAAVNGLAPKRGKTLLWVVTVPALVLPLVPQGTVPPLVEAAGLAIWTALAIVAGLGTVLYAMRAEQVDTEHVYAALSSYMLAGVFMGVLYAAVETVWPGSMVDASAATPGEFPVESGIYFSFVTLATLGYGDVLPRTPLTRGLAVVEAVAGQLYIAVTIAKLVGAAARRPRGSPP